MFPFVRDMENLTKVCFLISFKYNGLNFGHHSIIIIARNVKRKIELKFFFRLLLPKRRRKTTKERKKNIV